MTTGANLAARLLATACGLASIIGAAAESRAQPLRDGAQTPAITAAQIELLKSQSGEIKNEAIREKAVKLYDSALGEVKRADKLRADTAAALKASGEAAPERQRLTALLEKLRQRPRPEPPSEYLELNEIERELKSKERDLALKKQALPPLEADSAARGRRRKELREKLDELPKQIEELEKEIAAQPPAGEDPAVTAARRIEQQARLARLRAEGPAYKAELDLYVAEDVEGLPRHREDVHEQQIKNLEAEVEVLRTDFNRRTNAEAENRVSAARRAVDAAKSEETKSIAGKNLQLAAKIRELAEQTRSASDALKQTRENLETRKKQVKDTQTKVESVGLTGPVGVVLRRQRRALPDVAEIKRRIRKRQGTIQDLQYESLSAAEEREKLPPAEDEIKRLVSAGVTEAGARELLDRRREYYHLLIDQYGALLITIESLDSEERALVRSTEQYAQYIDERILWIRSGRLLSRSDLAGTPAAIASVFSPTQWGELLDLGWDDVREHPWVYLLAVVFLGLLHAFGHRFRKTLAQLGEEARRGTCCEIVPTLRTLVLTVFISLLWPGLIWFSGWRIEQFGLADGFAQQAAGALNAVAWFYLPVEFLRQSCRKDGLAEAHFGWPSGAARLLRFHIRWLTLTGVVLLFVTTVLHEDFDPIRDAPERVVYALSMLVLTAFFHLILRPGGSVFRELIAYNPNGWTDRLRYVWYAMAVLAPLALAGLAVAGYYYTAYQLTSRAQSTAFLLVAVLLFREFLQRWIVVRRRKLAIEQARERRAAAAAERALAAESAVGSAAQTLPGETPTAEIDDVPKPDPTVDLSASTTQAARMANTGLIVCAVVGVWLIWVDVFPALGFLRHKALWHTTATASEQTTAADGTVSQRAVEKIQPITAADVSLAVLIAIVVFVAARNLPGLLEIAVLQRLPLDPAVRFAITTLSSYTIAIVGVVVTAGTIGIGWSQVQWLAAALTFGLGFGLQEIFANFVSGLIILFERPIRVGDYVTVGDVSGQVTRIRIRATTIRGWDRKELVVPNKEFITGRVLNWTLTDAVNRIEISVGVAYGSDTDKAHRLLTEIIAAHPKTLDKPVPKITFEAFADSTLNFRCRVFLAKVEERLYVLHDINTTIHRRFHEEGIEIAFPQRDLHLRTVPDGWPDGGGTA